MVPQGDLRYYLHTTINLSFFIAICLLTGYQTSISVPDFFYYPHCSRAVVNLRIMSHDSGNNLQKSWQTVTYRVIIYIKLVFPEAGNLKGFVYRGINQAYF